MSSIQTSNFNILLVEDNPSDQMIARETLEDLSYNGGLHAVDDGEQALQFLKKSGSYSESPRPDLILLDLNIPRLNGKEVLKKLKTDDELRSIPIIVLTTSTHPKDIDDCYQMNANCYLVKPVELDDFGKLFSSLKTFWIESARLPAKTESFNA